MKPILLCMALLVLFSQYTCGQALVSHITAEFTSYSSSNFIAPTTRPKGTVALMSFGGGLMGVGGIVVLWGALTSYGAYGKSHVDQAILQRGHTIEYTGAGLMAGGLAMIIIGADRLKTAKYGRWSVVAPANNEMGLAYNF